MEHFAKTVNGFKPLIILAKISILDVWQSSDYASDNYEVPRQKPATLLNLNFFRK